MKKFGGWMMLSLLAGWLAGGCSLDNGLPKELLGHLADRGIKVVPSRVQAPLASRAGYVVARYQAQTVTNLVATFKLERITSADPRWRLAIGKVGATVIPQELWGVAGRPPQFKLESRGQFEYFYLLITTDGQMYLIAEYAYG